MGGMKTYWRHKEQGLCVSCGKPAISGKVLCEACREKNSSRVHERVLYLKSKGICYQCGKADARPEGVLCAACLSKKREQNKRKSNVQV